MTLYLTTDSRQDLSDCGERCTDAAQREFARAWELAARLIGKAAGITIEADASGDVRRADEWRRWTREALPPRNDEDTLASDLWQSVHDSIYTRRPGQGAVNRAMVAKAGRRLAAELDRRGAL